MASIVPFSKPLLALHRVSPCAVPVRANDAGLPVVLPLRLFHTDVVRGRRQLHRVLGGHLGCYRMQIDPARRCLNVRLSLHQGEVAACMDLLAQGMADAEFGRVERVPAFAQHHMPEVVPLPSYHAAVVVHGATACVH